MSNYNNYNSAPYQSNAAWETEQAYARIWREEQLKNQQNYREERNVAADKYEQKRLLKRDLKRAGFFVMSLVGVYSSARFAENEILDPSTTVDNRIGYQVKMSDTKIKNLDNSEPWEELKYIKDAPEKITLEKGSHIRTNDWSYKNVPKRERQGSHTEIATLKEDLEFEIPNGAVHGHNGRIGVRIEDLEKTADGRHTGIKPEVDEDGWVFVNIEPEE